MLSTKASPILDTFIPESEVISKQELFFATDHKMVSSTIVNIHGDAPDPCPVPRILRTVLLIQCLVDVSCPVLSL